MTWSQPGIREAYVISAISLGLTVLAFILGIVVTVASSSSATLGFALENAVDTFSSALVLWRFWGGGASVPEAVLEQREKRASIGIAASFIVLGLVVGSVAIQHLRTHDELKEVGALYGLAVPSMLIFFVLGSMKWKIGAATRSASLKKDAACSLCGSLLSLGVILASMPATHARRRGTERLCPSKPSACTLSHPLCRAPCSLRTTIPCGSSTRWWRWSSRPPSSRTAPS